MYFVNLQYKRFVEWRIEDRAINEIIFNLIDKKIVIKHNLNWRKFRIRRARK